MLSFQPGGENLFLSGNLLLATPQTRGSSANCPILNIDKRGQGRVRARNEKIETGRDRVMNNKAYWLASAVLMALPQVSNAQEAIAEEPDGGDNVIVVTAQRQAQSLQDVPIAVSAFSAESLRTQQIENASDLQLTLPNVSFSKDRKSTRLNSSH